MIEMGKQYRTRDGREVRIYAVDGGVPNMMPRVHGAWLGSLDEGGWSVCSWSKDGFYYDHLNNPHDLDLIEVKPTIMRTYWLLHWRKGDSSICFFAPIAASEMKPECIGVTGPHKITFTEGEGLS